MMGAIQYGRAPVEDRRKRDRLSAIGACILVVIGR